MNNHQRNKTTEIKLSALVSQWSQNIPLTKHYLLPLTHKIMSLCSTINLISTQSSPGLLGFCKFNAGVYTSLQLGHDKTTQYISRVYRTLQSFPILPGSVQFSSCVPLGDDINLLFFHIPDTMLLSGIADSWPILNKKTLCPLAQIFSCIIPTGLHVPTIKEHGQTIRMQMGQNPRCDWSTWQQMSRA